MILPSLEPPRKGVLLSVVKHKANCHLGLLSWLEFLKFPVGCFNESMTHPLKRELV